MVETGNKEKDMMMGHHSVAAEKSFKRRKVFLTVLHTTNICVCVCYVYTVIPACS